MDQTTEQAVQPEVTQTTTTLTAEQPTETTAPETPAVDFQSLIPAEYKELVIKKRNLFIKRFGGVVVKGSVKINDNQRQLIEDLYRNSNTRFAKVISMDLSRLGYSVNKNSI